MVSAVLVSIYQTESDPFVKFLRQEGGSLGCPIRLIHSRDLFDLGLMNQIDSESSFLLDRSFFKASPEEAFGPITSEADFLQKLTSLKAFQDSFKRRSGTSDFLGLSFHEASLSFRWQFAKDHINLDKVDLPIYYEGPGPSCPLDWEDDQLVVCSPFDSFNWKPASKEEKTLAKSSLECFVKRRPKGFPVIVEMVGDEKMFSVGEQNLSEFNRRTIFETIDLISNASRQSLLEFLFFVEGDEVCLASYHRDFHSKLYDSASGKSFLIKCLNKLLQRGVAR